MSTQQKYLVLLIAFLAVTFIFWTSRETPAVIAEEDSPLFSESLNNSVARMEGKTTIANATPICNEALQETEQGATCTNTQCVETSGCRPTCDSATCDYTSCPRKCGDTFSPGCGFPTQYTACGITCEFTSCSRACE